MWTITSKGKNHDSILHNDRHSSSTWSLTTRYEKNLSFYHRVTIPWITNSFPSLLHFPFLLLLPKNKEKKETVTMITNESYDAKRMNFANSSSRRKTEPPLLYHRLHRRAKNINLFKKKGEEYEKSKEEITILVVQRVWL